MKIVQKKLSNKHVFEFGQDYLNFSYKDGSGTGDIDTLYADIPEKTLTRIDNNTWLRNVGYIWIFIGLVEVFLAISNGRSLNANFLWLLGGSAFVALFYITTVVYTVINVNEGGIWIIQDKNTHDQILNEIKERKKSQLLAWYGDINLDNTLEQEINKFNWLAHQQVISREKADKLIKQVEAAHAFSEKNEGVTIN